MSPQNHKGQMKRPENSHSPGERRGAADNTRGKGRGKEVIRKVAKQKLDPTLRWRILLESEDNKYLTERAIATLNAYSGSGGKTDERFKTQAFRKWKHAAESAQPASPPLQIGTIHPSATGVHFGDYVGVQESIGRGRHGASDVLFERGQRESSIASSSAPRRNEDFHLNHEFNYADDLSPFGSKVRHEPLTLRQTFQPYSRHQPKEADASLEYSDDNNDDMEEEELHISPSPQKHGQSYNENSDSDERITEKSYSPEIFSGENGEQLFALEGTIDSYWITGSYGNDEILLGSGPEESFNVHDNDNESDNDSDSGLTRDEVYRVPLSVTSNQTSRVVLKPSEFIKSNVWSAGDSIGDYDGYIDPSTLEDAFELPP
jgi:hypothetical protein